MPQTNAHAADKCIRFGFSSILCITKRRDMFSRFSYTMLQMLSVGTGIEPLTASTRKSVGLAEWEIIEPRIVEVQNILAVDARETIRCGLSNAQTELQSKQGWDS
jgi:ABC-type antimicrobial peptide transport system ATPase subunit